MNIIVEAGQPVLTREAVIKFNGSEDISVMTFGLIPENWQGKEMESHPADDLVGYWLTAYEWIRFGSGFDGSSDFEVISA